MAATADPHRRRAGILALAIAAALYFAPCYAGDTSIHELLRAHGLPGGLVPRAVQNYTLDEASGGLVVRLERPCYAKYAGNLALFDSVVRGNLSFGALRGVQGLSQEELFVWLPVKGILVINEPGVILFDIGLAHKRLSRAVFEEPPDCRPGQAPASADAGAAEGLQRGAEMLLDRSASGIEEQRK